MVRGVVIRPGAGCRHGPDQPLGTDAIAFKLDSYAAAAEDEHAIGDGDEFLRLADGHYHGAALASDALRIGLVNAVCEAGSLKDSALALARRLLACSPMSVELTKQGIYRAESASPEEADHLALEAVATAASGPD